MRIVSLFIAILCCANAARVYVGNGGDYTNLIDALSSITEDTDIVLLKNSSHLYQNPLNITHNVPFAIGLYSEDSSVQSVIDCNITSFFRLAAKSAVFKSIHIRGCSMALSNMSSLTIDSITKSVVSNERLEVVNCPKMIVQNSIFNNGTNGLRLVRSNGTIDHCTFTQNNAESIFDQNSNCTITNCIFSQSSFAALLVLGGSSLNVANCSFTSYQGTPLQIDQASVRVSNCTFSNNRQVSRNGGAIFTTSTTKPSQLVVDNTVFSSNAALAGGCIHSFNTIVEIYNSRFYNSTAAKGGGINIMNSTLTVVGSIFDLNKADKDGGSAIAASTTRVILESSTFSGNTGTSYGAVFIWNPSPDQYYATINNCTWDNNKSTGNGGGLSINQTTVSLSHSLFTSNTAVTAGGGAYLSESNNVVDNVVFIHNQVLVPSGGSYGGGLYIYQQSSRLNSSRVINSRFQGNNATFFGGGLYWAKVHPNSASTASQYYIDNCVFHQNSGKYGGGVFLLGIPNKSHLQFNNSVISNNVAFETGGGISLESVDIQLNNLTFANNSYLSAERIAKSSVIYTWNCSITISDATIDSSNTRTQLSLLNTRLYVSSGEEIDDATCYSDNTTYLECLTPNCTISNNCTYIDPITSSSSSIIDTNTPSASQQQKPSSSSSHSKSVGIGIGVTLGLLLLLLILGILIFLHKRRRERQSQLMYYGMTTLNSPTKIGNTAPLLTDVVKKERIGGGNFGQVYAGVWNGSTKVALKSLRGGSEVQSQFEREAALLFKLNHPNIVRALGIYRKTNEEFFLVLEYCKLGSLDSFLARSDYRARLNTSKLLKLCMDIAAGCKFMEQKGVIHRDLGARNVLVTEVDGDFTAKISDLGLSRETNYYKAEQKDIPYKWSSPETIRYGTSTTASDVWSFGVTMWEIFTYGQKPYQEMTNKDVIDQVAHGDHRLSQPKDCPDAVFEVMSQCWKAAPDERPSFLELYKQIGALWREHDLISAESYINSQEKIESNFYSE